MEYKLTKTQKGKKNLYVVTDETGKQISQRLSARDYVACTADGRYFFGRRDLIGKGDHGKMLSYANDILSDPEKSYKKMLAYWTPDYRKEWKSEHPYEEWKKERTEYAQDLKRNLEAIAYLN